MIKRIEEIYARCKDFLLIRTDPALLIFILFMFNYRLSLKLLALVFIYYVRPNFRIKRDGIVMFYFSIVLLALFNLLFLSGDFSIPHIMVVMTSCATWTAGLLAYHQVRYAIKINHPLRIENTLKVLAVINFVVSVIDIVKIMLINHTINPYSQIIGPPYGISSGDLVGGVFGRLHLVNTVISCFLTLFFIRRSCFTFAVLSLIPFLLTGSNLATLILGAGLLYILFFVRGVTVKYFALFCIPIIVIFYDKVTPENSRYMKKTLREMTAFVLKKKPESMAPAPVTEAAKREPTKEEKMYAYVAYKQKQQRLALGDSTVEMQQKVLSQVRHREQELKKIEWAETDLLFFKKDSVKNAKLNDPFYEKGQLKKFDLRSEPGKVTSFKQTAAYLSSDWRRALFGGGPASFSSRLAFVVSGIVYDSRIYSMLPRYETPEFRDNHKAIFKYLTFLDDETHSITNLPFCWYNEVLAEYGLVGLCLFVFFYLGFFVKRFRLLTYGKMLFVAMLAFFLFDYWYERLSVVILFELLILLDLSYTSLEKDTAS